MRQTSQKHKAQTKGKTQQSLKTHQSQRSSQPKIEPKIELDSPEADSKIKCSVCREILKTNSESIECLACKKKIHKMCYQGDGNNDGEFCSNESRNEKKFYCDMCSEKNKKAICSICLQVGPEEVLKFLKLSNEFVHVECAILSPAIEVLSYSKLKFSRKMTEKAAENLACCGMSCQGAILRCVECQKKGHFRCWIVEQGEDMNYYLISKWLDKTEKNNYLLHYFLENNTSFENLFSKPSEPKYNELVVCPSHQNTYAWCPCANKKISNEKDSPSYQCETCDRFYHQPCSGLPKNSDDPFYCSGCKEGDIFKKELKFHELMNEVFQIENGLIGNWTERTIRLLNALPFKYSHLLKEKIQQNCSLIQSYFARKEFEMAFEKKCVDKKSSNKILKHLLIMTFGSEWEEKEEMMRRTDVDLSNIMVEILKFKTFPISQETQDKIRHFLFQIKAEAQQNKEYELFKQELINFIESCKTEQHALQGKSFEYLTCSIKKLQERYLNYEKTLKESESIQLKEKLSKMFGNEIFTYLIVNKIDEEVIEKMLLKLSKIKYFQTSNKELKEQEYHEIINSNDENISVENQEVFKKLTEVVKKQAINLNIGYECIRKEDRFNYFIKKTQQKDRNLTSQALINIENTAVREGICLIEADKSYISLKLSLFEANMLKKKILKMATEGDENISESSCRNICRIQTCLKKINDLNEEERTKIDNFIGKLEYVEAMLKRVSYCDYNNESDIENLDEQEEIISKNIFTEIYQYFLNVSEDNWTIIESVVVDIDIKCSSKNLKFNYPKVYEDLRNFMRKVVGKIEDLFEENVRISISMLRRVFNIVSYLGIIEEFEFLQHEYNKVKEWLQILDPLEQKMNIDIGAYLEKPEILPVLLKDIDAKLFASEEITKVKINDEVNKFYLLRQWCRLTEKMNLVDKVKPTIHAIQTLKSLMDKTHYPENNLSRKISDLEIESRKLNKEINKFLEKTKIGNKLTFYDEIKFVSNKITLEEGQKIRISFENSNLDACLEKQELETEMSECESFPTELSFWAENKCLEDLNQMRKKIMECCFKPQKIEEYEELLRKFYWLKCVNFEGPTTREEYFQLLSLGGVASIKLEEKTQSLLLAYKNIQQAENETISHPKKRNFSNLLSCMENEYRSMKESLIYDPNEQSKLERAYLRNHKLRDEFQRIKIKREGDLEKYKELECELTYSIFNNNDIILKIGAIRRDFYNLKQKVEEIVPYGQRSQNDYIPEYIHDNIFRRDRGLLETYLNIGIRHPTMDQFEFDCRIYRKIEQMKPIEFEKYEEFVCNCQKMSDPASRIKELLELRETEFWRNAEMIEESKNKNVNFYQTLITEGLELRRLNSPKCGKIFDKIFTFYQQIKTINESQQSERNHTNQNKQFESNSSCSNGGHEDDEEINENHFRKRPSLHPEDFQSDDENESEESSIHEFDEDREEKENENEKESESISESVDDEENENKADEIVVDDSD